MHWNFAQERTGKLADEGNIVPPHTRKILVLTHAGGSPYHGPNMRWYYLGQALARLGVQIEIVSSSSFHKYISPPEVTAPLYSESVDGLVYHWIRTRPYRSRGVSQVTNQAEFVFGCYRHSKMLRSRKPDVVVSSGPHPFVNFPAVSIARGAGARFIMEVRDLWPAVLLELGRFRRWHPYIQTLKAAERYGVDRASRIVSVKPGDLEYFQEEYGVHSDRFIYAPNGFLPEKAPRREPPAVIAGLRSRYRFIVGYVGALSAYYGLEHLVELANRFRHRPEVGFVAVGKGDRANALEAEAKQSGLSNIHFVGAVDKQAVPATIGQFDVCYVGLEDLKIHRFGISCNKIYEYMYAGKPIIGSYVAGYDPVREANCGVTAPPGDYLSLVEALERMFKDETLRADYGRRGREYFDAKHDFRVVAADLARRLFSDEMPRSPRS